MRWPTLTVQAGISTYALGGEQVAWLSPGIPAEEVNLFRGQVGYEYPLPLPRGPKGFGPDLILRYSSDLVNRLISQEIKDTNWVGLGWDLSVGHLQRGEGEVTVFGQSYRLEEQHFIQLSVAKT